MFSLIISIGNCVDLLIFDASINYLHYAHKLDSENVKSSVKKSQHGLFTAAHDLGVMFNCGIFYTSTLPAYHFANAPKAKREWLALHMLLKGSTPRQKINITEGGNDIAITGKIEKWNGRATERPDFSIDGLRDFGDFEIQYRLLERKRDPKYNRGNLLYYTEQNILSVNSGIEQLFATNLLFCRVLQNATDYHYKNPQMITELSSFIENILTQFLIGYYNNQNIQLQQFLEISTDDYNKTLNRAAKEALYWTARQYDETDKHSLDGIFSSETFDFNDGYAKHIIETGRFSDELYPEQNVDRVVKYPQDFEDSDNDKSLGMRNSTLPLKTLMHLLILFFTKIIDDDRQ